MIVNLQVLRALAAFMVIAQHLIPHIAEVYPSTANYVAGLSGVDVFFVISGFIMVVTTSRSQITSSQFMLNRIVRVAPVYWLMTAMISAAYFIGFRPIGVLTLEWENIWKSALFIPFTRSGRWEPVVSVGWTLNYEMFFYFVFAMLLTAQKLFPRIALLVAIFVLLVVLNAISSLPPILSYYGNPIVIDFAMGAILGYLYTSRGNIISSRSKIDAYLMIATAIIIEIAFSKAKFLDSASIFRPFIWGVAGFLLVFSFLILEAKKIVFRQKLLTALGDASFSIYLIHPLIIQVVMKSIAAIGMGGAAGLSLGIALSVFLSSVAGMISYRYIETPINGAYRNYRRRRLQIAPT